MFDHSAASPREIRRELAPLGEVLRRALTDACDQGVRYHEQNRFEIVDPWVHATLARQWALRYLARSEIERLGFRLEPTTNVGIHLVGEQYQLRVLKVERRRNLETGQLERGVPFSRSLSREREFTQPLLDGLLHGETFALRGLEPPMNLVSLWETDHAFQLLAVDLARAKGVNARRNAVHLHWMIPFDSDDLTGLLDRGPSPAPTPILLADLEVYRSTAPEEIAEPV